MSLKTWKKKFYPKPASAVKTDKAALLHGLLKWTGLLPQNLRKHGVDITVDDDLWNTKTAEVFLIDGDTCALCALHYRKGVKNKTPSSCSTCPLALSIGQRCDQSRGPFAIGPFLRWIHNRRDPKPMIKALEKAIRENAKTPRRKP